MELGYLTDSSAIPAQQPCPFSRCLKQFCEKQPQKVTSEPGADSGVRGGRVSPERDGSLGSRWKSRAMFPQTTSSCTNPCLVTRTNSLAPPESEQLQSCPWRVCDNVITYLRTSSFNRRSVAPRQALPSLCHGSPASRRHSFPPRCTCTLSVPFGRFLHVWFLGVILRCCCWLGGAAEDQPCAASYGIKLQKKFERERR